MLKHVTFEVLKKTMVSATEIYYHKLICLNNNYINYVEINLNI